MPNGPSNPWGTTIRVLPSVCISAIPPLAKLETNIRFSWSNAALSSPTMPLATTARAPVFRSIRVTRPAMPRDRTTSTPPRSNRTATGSSTSSATSSGTPPSGGIRQTSLRIICG
ncbi:hypothetical protein SANTM175S_07862 [Streptomyces antimycoticus]